MSSRTNSNCSHGDVQAQTGRAAAEKDACLTTETKNNQNDDNPANQITNIVAPRPQYAVLSPQTRTNNAAPNLDGGSAFQALPASSHLGGGWTYPAVWSSGPSSSTAQITALRAPPPPSQSQYWWAGPDLLLPTMAVSNSEGETNKNSTMIPNYHAQSQHWWPVPHGSFPAPSKSGEEDRSQTIRKKDSSAGQEDQKDSPVGNEMQVSSNATCGSHEHKPNSSSIVVATDLDVLYGKNGLRQRAGNLSFKKLVASKAADYKQATESQARKDVIKTTLDAFSGRFLEYKEELKGFVELTAKESQTKVRESLYRAACRLDNSKSLNRVARKQKEATAATNMVENQSLPRVSPHDPYLSPHDPFAQG